MGAPVVKDIPIENFGSKGLVKWKSNNKTPSFYAQTTRNIRIKNQGITVRDGIATLYNDDTKTPIRGIVGNQLVFYTQWSHLWSFNPTTLAVADLWAIWTDVKCNFITHGIFTIVLTGAWLPRYYDDNSLTQVTTAELSSWVNPIMWATFAGFTCVAWNGASDKNVLYVSRPVTPANPGYCHDWKGTDSEQISLKWDIQGIVGTITNLFIFTTQTIEYISRESLSTTWGVASLYTIPLGQWSQLASPNAVVGAGDKIFYLTLDKKIRTIGFKPGIVYPQLGDLSDVPLVGIDGFMQDLADDQSASHAIFDRTRNLVKFRVRSRNSAYNDTVIIYDLINDTWLVDDNKKFVDICEYNNQYYGAWSFVATIYQEETGTTDMDEAIDREYATTNLWFGMPGVKKEFKWFEFAGTIGNQTNIYFDTIVDDRVILRGVVKWTDRTSWVTILWIWSNTIGWEMIGWNLDPADTEFIFDAIVSKGYIRHKWKRIWIRFHWNDSLSPKFIIDYLGFRIRGLGVYERADKKINSI